jgi:hypothetical protein
VAFQKTVIRWQQTIQELQDACLITHKKDNM